MSRGLKKFIGGFALTTLDQIQKREADQRDIEKAKMLQQLRLEQEKEMFEYQDLLNRSKPDKAMSTDDFGTGKRNLRNEYGQDIGTMDLPSSAIDEYKSKKQKDDLDIQNVKSQIESRTRDDVRQERSTNAYIGSLDRQAATGSGTAGAITHTDRANEIKFRQKDIVDSLRDSGVPAEVIQQALIDSVKGAHAAGLPPAKAEEIFVNSAGKIRQIWMKSKGNTRRVNKTLDTMDKPVE